MITLIILAILFLLMWFLAFKMIKFDIDLIVNPEEKKLLRLDDAIQNKTLVKIIQSLIIGCLVLLFIVIVFSEHFLNGTIGITNPLIVIPAIILFSILFLFGLRQIRYTLKMISINGLMPVLASVLATLISGGIIFFFVWMFATGRATP